VSTVPRSVLAPYLCQLKNRPKEAGPSRNTREVTALHPSEQVVLIHRSLWKGHFANFALTVF
jgi:hypothetical protein